MARMGRGWTKIFNGGSGTFLNRENGWKKTVCLLCRGRTKTLTVFKTKFFVTIVNSWKPLTVLRKN